MKQYQMAGFGNYQIRDNKTVIDTTTGKKVSMKKGIVTLVASEDVPEHSIVKGTSYPYEIATLMTLGTDSNLWADVPAETPANNGGEGGEGTQEPKEKTEADLRKEHIATLRGNVREKTEALKKAKTVEEIIAAKGEYDAAEKELADELAKGKDVEYTEAEKEAIAEWEAEKAGRDMLRAALAESTETLNGIKDRLPKGYKTTGTGGENPNKAAHVGYEVAQKIRAAYAVGRYGNEGTSETVKAIADRFGVSTTAVGLYVNYLQHKLQRDNASTIEGVEMNKAYTPLVNDYYPESWTSKDGVQRSGAPYAKDNVKEGTERYILHKNRKPAAPVAETPAAEGTQA